MGALFDRRVRLVAGGFECSALDFAFKVKKTLKPEPNSLDLQIFNLSASARGELGSLKKGVPVILEAGYKANPLTQIYFGEARAAWSYRQGADIVTQLAAGDGEKAARSRINVPIGPKAPPEQALRAIVAALGVKPGNQEAAVAQLKARGFSGYLSAGGALSGNASRALTDYCRSADLEWSIQDGVIQILDRGKATADKAFVLSAETGLVGQTSVDSQGVVNARTLLLPDLRPGRLVVFQSEFVKGAYRVEAVEYTGDTAGQSWYADIECKAW